jgi:iron complex outermembrane receptor protein
MVNELVAGIDFIKWERTTDASFAGDPYSNADANQKSKALYLRDELRFDAAHEGRISAGVRREIFDQDYSNPLSFAAYNVVQGLNAWELQTSYMPVPQLTVFGKLGQSYRVANADESSYTLVFNQPLVPQVSHDTELGASWANAAQKITARLVRHNLTNEIFFDPTLPFGGANTNLDPTRRQGVELDAEQRINAAWSVNAHYQHVQAKFRDGVNDGKEMVLVPKNTLTARISWIPASGQSADFGAQWVDKQRYGSDFTNTCSGEMPSFTTLDARYARKFGQWEWALSGQNLADKHYYSQAFSCKAGIYPADGRQLKLAARYDF